ncbi:MAG: hypothetical protein WDM78_12320 [Puia sp.]
MARILKKDWQAGDRNYNKAQQELLAKEKEDVAISMFNQSIAGGYSGIFALRFGNKGNIESSISKPKELDPTNVW